MVVSQGLSSVLASKRAREGRKIRAMEAIAAGLQGAMGQIAQAQQQQAQMEREDQLRAEEQKIRQEQFDQRMQAQQAQMDYKMRQDEMDREIKRKEGARKRMTERAKLTGVMPAVGLYREQGLGPDDYKYDAAVAKRTVMEQALDRAERQREKEVHAADISSKKALTAERREGAETERTLRPLKIMEAITQTGPEQVSPTALETTERMKFLAQQAEDWRKERDAATRREKAKAFVRDAMTEKDRWGDPIPLDKRSPQELLMIARAAVEYGNFAIANQMADLYENITGEELPE